MNDAGSETKRDSETAARYTIATENLVAVLGVMAEKVRATLAEASRLQVVERIWNRDAALWKQETAHQKIIANSLGWLTVADEMLAAAVELKNFAGELRASREFDHVMVCGMGGSSLCPEVLRQTFGKQTGAPELLVLDSTDPEAIANLAKQIEVTRCLFVIASKSGTTTEPNTFHRYWYHEVEQRSDAPGRSFITITDPGSQLAATAKAESFRRIFLNQPDIGGRYSALSYFGMVPAALMGLDVTSLLQGAQAMAKACAASVTATENPGALLGAVLAECARAGRDKLTIVTDEKLAALGLWIEQLIAESTGKEGKGIIPVVGEPLADASSYGNDRLFISISVGPEDDERKSRLKDLEAAGHPVLYRTLPQLNDLGAEFFLWEMATAFAGWRLGINSFDQPNVQESKDATKALLAAYESDGKLPEQTPIASEGELRIFGGEDAGVALGLEDALLAFLGQIKPGDYIALLAYIEETREIDAALQALRTKLRAASGCATTTGYGPRFLHSTGQLHKGGPDSGVFIQLTAPDHLDLAVPGSPYTFSILKDAQALGDFQSLVAHGRRAIRLDLGDDVPAGLRALLALLDQTLGA
jgi:transaldolase/glucose-6-phosphate isomerase